MGCGNACVLANCKVCAQRDNVCCVLLYVLLVVECIACCCIALIHTSTPPPSTHSSVPNSTPAVVALIHNLLLRAPDKADCRGACVALTSQLMKELPAGEVQHVLLGMWRLARSAKVGVVVVVVTCVCAYEK